MNQTRVFWILVAFACANFVCVPIHAEKELALTVTDDFSATEPDAKIWHVQGDVNIDEGAAVLVGHGWNGTGFWSRKSFGPGTTFEVEFTASDDSEFAIFVGPFATSGNYFIEDRLLSSRYLREL